MSAELRKISSSTFDLKIPELKAKNKEELLKSFKLFEEKKSELIYYQQQIQQALNEIDKREKEGKAKLEQFNQPIVAQISPANPKAGTLFINTHKIVKSKDGNGEREHYKVTLISKDNQEVEIDTGFVDTKKFGDIKQIAFTDGVTENALNDIETTARLIKYITTDFETFRKEINKDALDRNGYYPNKYVPFDCQKFCYYMQHGKEAAYKLWPDDDYTDSFRNEGSYHRPGRFYKITAYKANFGKNGRYNEEDMSVHYYVCLANDVFVSKFGRSSILFTSYDQILKGYFPKDFIKGKRVEI